MGWGSKRNKWVMTWRHIEVERNHAVCLRVRVFGFSPVQEEMETGICMRCPIERQPFNLCSHSPPGMEQYWVWNLIIIQLQPISCTVLHIRVAFGLDNALLDSNPFLEAGKCGKFPAKDWCFTTWRQMTLAVRFFRWVEQWYTNKNDIWCVSKMVRKILSIVYINILVNFICIAKQLYRNI